MDKRKCKSKSMGTYNRISFLTFSKLYLLVEAKIVTMSNIVFQYVKKIFKTIINGEIRNTWI